MLLKPIIGTENPNGFPQRYPRPYGFCRERISFRVQIDNDDDNGTFVPTDLPPKSTEAIEMTEKFRLLATMQQPQLHQLITELQSQLIDVYIAAVSLFQNSRIFIEFQIHLFQNQHLHFTTPY